VASGFSLYRSREFKCAMQGVGDRAVFADILVQQLDPLVGFRRIDNQLVSDRYHFRRTVLSLTMKRNLKAAQIKLYHWGHAFGPFNHAGSE